MSLNRHQTFFGIMAMMLPAVAFNILENSRRYIEPESRSRNPVYFGYSLNMYETADGQKGFFIGAPKTINASAPLFQDLPDPERPEPLGSVSHCSLSNTYPNWKISRKTMNLSTVAEEGDNFGTLLKIMTDGMIVACSPTRSLTCDTSMYTTGVCYSTQNMGYSWMELFKDSRKCPTLDVDVLFLVDGSASIGSKNFERIKKWIKDISDKIPNVKSGNVHFGVVQYSQYFENIKSQPYIKTYIRIGEYTNHRQFSSAIDRINFHNSTTYTGHALQKVKIDFQQSPNYGKIATKQVLILLTDGEADDSHIVPSAAEELRRLDVILYSVGVGKEVNKEQLRVIANGNETDDTRVFMVDDYDGLSDVARELQENISVLLLEGQISSYSPSHVVSGQFGFSAAIGRYLPHMKDRVSTLNALNNCLCELMSVL